MKAVTRGQLSEIIARFATQTGWHSIDGDLLQQRVINLTSEELGRRFTLFLQNGAQITLRDITIIPQSLDPVSFIAKDWSFVAKEHDARNSALKEVAFSRVAFETCLASNEPSIKGEEKLKRLKAAANIRLDATVFMGLWKDYQENGENSVLEQLYRTQKLTSMDFFGDVLLGPDGARYVLCLSRDGGRWQWDCYCLAQDWNAGDRSASLASVELELQLA